MSAIESMRARLPAIQECKERERRLRIDLLIEAARQRGEDTDRIFWSIVHDLEEAPATTNRQQLEELGFSVACTDDLSTFDSERVAKILWEVFEALAVIQVFICRTNHLSDEALLEELVSRVLEEPVPDLPLSVGARDWVDLSEKGGTSFEHRDDRLPRP